MVTPAFLLGGEGNECLTSQTLIMFFPPARGITSLTKEKTSNVSPLPPIFILDSGVNHYVLHPKMRAEGELNP